MTIEVGDRVDIVEDHGFVPQGLYEVVRVNHGTATLRDRQSGQLRTIETAKLAPFDQGRPIKWS